MVVYRFTNSIRQTLHINNLQLFVEAKLYNFCDNEWKMKIEEIYKLLHLSLLAFMLCALFSQRHYIVLQIISSNLNFTKINRQAGILLKGRQVSGPQSFASPA